MDMSLKNMCYAKFSWDGVGGLGGREFNACRFFNFTMWPPNITFPGGSGQLDLIRRMVG